MGDGCDSCLTPRDLWTDIDKIEEGFEMDRSLGRVRLIFIVHSHCFFLDNIKAVWENLDKKKTGEVRKETGDYEQRGGLCHKPLTQRETFSFTITHKVGEIIVTN